MFERCLKKIEGFIENLISALIYSFRKIFLPGSLNILSDNTIGRYFVGELLLYFFVSFLFFFMVFFVNQILLLAENILQKRVPVGDVILLVTYCLPFIIAQSAPFATLVGFLMCIGQMMSSNEILIIRASGLGYKKILAPVLSLGLIISVVSFFVNDYLLPLGTINYLRLYRNILQSNPSVEIEPHSIKRTNDSTLIIGDVNGTDISDLILFDTDRDGDQRIMVSGHSSVIKSRQRGVVMQISMDNAFALLLDKANRSSYDTLKARSVDLNIFESSFFDQPSGINPREMTSFDLFRRISEMKKDENTPGEVLNQYVLEYNKKFSMPFGSLFFALLAVPLAIIFGKHNGQTIGLIIGIFISVFYWAVMILGQIFSSRSGHGGFISMWIPNIIIAGAGSLFYIGMIRK
ncbi:YjgP/YjgQ family permease [Treponema parvum]|uniref:YjgP/YjgQ family permease n=2 Tax=Treponema parvum TaxID=138851 RepID=A0A975F6D3_9SPIR|nr:YjgP/YjgQ family permease [Treponema parvum]